MVYMIQLEKLKSLVMSPYEFVVFAYEFFHAVLQLEEPLAPKL